MVSPFSTPLAVSRSPLAAARRRAGSTVSTFLSRRLPLVAMAAAALALAPAARAQTTTPRTGLTFSTVQALAGNAQGAGPFGSLAQGPDGNFYGTTYLGGTGNSGTVFRVTPAGVITPLHSFTGADGSNPQSGLLLANDGYIYGTTYYGGGAGDGTIFRVQPLSGAFQSLHSFSGKDGANPYAGLTQISGVFYGSTVIGGSANQGTLFSFSPNANPPSLAVLHNFTGLSDGGNPLGAPVAGNDGNLYGTAATGGNFFGGTVYQYIPGQGLTTLHAFSLGEPTGPQANLLLAADGSFYGTTIDGGASNKGAIFNISNTGALSTFYSFGGGTDGAAPQSALIQGSDGTFYGTAAAGGANGAGTVFSITPAGILSTVYTFTGNADGGTPETGLIRAGNGSLYGTTYDGGSGAGANGNGTIYQLAFAGSAGAIEFSAPTFSTIESIGKANVTVSRVNGTSGAVSAGYATSDGTAVNGTDYTAVSGTLTWTDGDDADKTIAVPILDRKITDGSSRTVNLTLTTFTGATAGAPTTATLTIVDNDQPPVQPTIAITSPPADISVVTGTPLTLAASVTDPNSTLAQVQFFLNGALYAKTSAAGPFSKNVTAPAPGTYTLGATAIDTLGRQSSATRTITVIAANETDPAPTTSIITDLDGRLLASGTTIFLSASAISLDLAGEPLGRVDFYADTTLIASFDGAGNPIPTTSAPHQGAAFVPGAPRTSSVRRTAATASAPTATLFKTPFTIPSLDKLINLLTVATTQSGRSQVSSSVTIKATTSTANRPPTAVIKNVVDGARVKVGSTLNIPVTVADPDANGSTTSAYVPGRRVSALTPPIGVISSVDYYLNQLKIATSTAPPYAFNVTPPAAGTYEVEAIVTDGAGLSNVAVPVTINAFATPTVTITAPGGTNKGQVNEGATAKVMVTRDGDLTGALTINYKTKGPNVPGVDYKSLPGTLTIPAGAASATIKVSAFNNGVAGPDKVLTIKLLTPADGSYTIGTPGQAKIDIINVNP